MKDYSGFDDLPQGNASDHITEGLLVLEGGAWRGMYTQGALDALMEEDINLSATVGVSAGALSGMSYVSGQIGRSVRLNLSHRHDSEYTGRKAVMKEHGVTGFNYLFFEMGKEIPLDAERFFNPKRRFIVTVTNIETGKTEFMEKGKCPDIFRAIQASATVPSVSEAVEIDGKRYLDGGIEQKIPLDWALAQPEKKKILIRTRDRAYRKPLKAKKRAAKLEYGKKYPNLMMDLYEESAHYNILLNRIDQLEELGEIFVLAPSRPVSISRFEGDVEELGALYWLGYNDAKQAAPAMKEFLKG